MKELTFKEVIANIKEGEVWESEFVKITKDTYGDIDITWKEYKERKVYTFASTTKYELKRKQYSFEEAFKAYEEGKEIESMKFKYQKIQGGDKFYSPNHQTWFNNDGGFEPVEIRNKWYINN